jgi:hypothetical protein
MAFMPAMECSFGWSRFPRSGRDSDHDGRLATEQGEDYKVEPNERWVIVTTLDEKMTA